VQGRDGFGKIDGPLSSTPYTTAGSTNAIRTYHGAGIPVPSVAQPIPTQLSQHVFRAARPPYTEEQKFFIVYHRIINELSWPEIEDKFVSHFNFRSQDDFQSRHE
jgi:hypothetical protein